jgi:flagellar hook-basal body complex protein FliE
MALPPILRDTPIAGAYERYSGQSAELNGIKGLDGNVGHVGGAPATTHTDGASFADALTGALSRAGAEEKAANDAAERFANGDPGMGIHEVMIASEKASISVRYAVTLKNKMLEAYKELMNTPL